MKKSLKIKNWKFEVKPVMRYETCGDWYDNGLVQVAKGLDDVETAAVAIHELFERTLLAIKGIGQREIDSYDIVGDGSYDERMYSKNPIYEKADDMAEKVERMIIAWAGKDWAEYDKKVMNLDIKWKKL
jgi:hypothetical protein